METLKENKIVDKERFSNSYPEKTRQELSEQGHRILEHWNSKKIIKHRPTIAKLPRTIEFVLKENSEEEIKQAITNYATEVHDINYRPFPSYKTYIWSLPFFLFSAGRKPFLRYLPDGDKWINYCRYKGIELTQEKNSTELNIVDICPSFPTPDANKVLLYKQVLKWLKDMPYEEYLQTEHWRHFREQALIYANNRCQICGENRYLQVHHRIYENRGQETFLDIVVLCESCHKKTHKK